MSMVVNVLEGLREVESSVESTFFTGPDSLAGTTTIASFVERQFHQMHQ